MNLAKLISASNPNPLSERSALDRRWCSDRRVLERRTRQAPVAVERRMGLDRRAQRNRRSGIDRRGEVVVKTLWHHRCSQAVGDQRRCDQPAILRSPLGWRCFWHLDRRFERRGG